GLGGEQGHPFLMWPTQLSEPDPDLVGAEAVHEVLRRWLREADGPQVPLTASAEDPRPEAGSSGTFPSARASVQDENH
ncbi:hypothetical protein VR46_34675, partial [Streptomyces sp. NRRL S-444]